MKKAVFLLFPVLIILFFGPAFPAAPDFERIYGLHYREALAVFQGKIPYYAGTLLALGADPNILLPVVFPEVLRHSALRDGIKTVGLHTFYVHIGGSSCDFSTGVFQMKPSFVEELEGYARLRQNADLSNITLYPRPDEKEIRSERVKRLEDEKWDLEYLAAFYKITARRFKDRISRMDTAGKVRFFASAYNSGFYRSYDDIVRISGLNFYPWGPGNDARNYGDVAVDFFTHHWKKVRMS